MAGVVLRAGRPATNNALPLLPISNPITQQQLLLLPTQTSDSSSVYRFRFQLTMNSRLPPPQGAPPSYAFVTRVYRRNLRPIVLFTAFLGGIWGLFSGIGWFRSYGIDKSQNVPHIANLSLALGVMYMAVFLIGLFGMYSAATQRTALVRIYAILASIATLIVVGTGLTRVVTHFVWKNDLINECASLSKDKQIVYYGFWGPIKADILDGPEAQAWCRRYWDRDSWAEIVALLILSVLAFFFMLLAFTYYRQLQDPTSPANASRAPSSQVRAGAYPDHYNPAYPSAVPNLSYSYGPNPYSGGQPHYAPPAGPPPGHDDAFVPPYDGKPPGYSGNGVPDGDSKYGKNPFDDFDGPSNREERDVTSRPAPGGPDSFR